MSLYVKPRCVGIPGRVKVYHSTRSCSYLKRSIRDNGDKEPRPITREMVQIRRLRPCEGCRHA